MRIAILEDDVSQRELLGYWLKLGGHQSCAFDQGQELLDDLKQTRFDALLLDWNIPDLTGIEVLRRVRRTSSIPILFCTGRDQEEDIAQALGEGADDYIVKPMRRMELLARLSSVARRSSELAATSEWLEVGSLRVNCQDRTIMRGSAVVVLSTKQFDLSVLLLSNVGRLLTRTNILNAVFPNVARTSRTLDTHIALLRTKLGLTEDQGWSLRAVYGDGYRLEKLTRSIGSKPITNGMRLGAPGAS